MKTKKPLELVQPNRVTSARHDYDVRQQNILTLMIDAVQKHISQDRGIDTDLFGEPTIVIDTADVGSNNKKHYWVSAEAMLTKTFEFEWRRPTDNRDIKTKGVLITTVHNVRGTSLLELTINKWAIPYLLYWGKV